MQPKYHPSSERSSGSGSRFLGLDVKEWLVLIVYCCMVCVAVLYYQQSEDEVRAWVLSRSFRLSTLIFQMIRYEGHPGLYYFFLWLLSHAGFPFVSINWFSAFAASAATYLLLRFAPFPFYLRAIIPFGFYLGYQYAVDARSYALFAVLGFTVVHLYRRAPAKPVLVAVLLAVFANISLHATMVAIGFAAAYVFQFISDTSSAPRTRRTTHTWLAMGIFGMSILFVIFCVWPPKYMHSADATTHTIIRRLTGPVNQSPIRDSGATAIESAPANLDSKTPVTTTAAVKSSPSRGIGYRIRLSLCYPVASSETVAILFDVLIAFYVVQRRRAVLLLPIGLLLYFFTAVYVQVWHVGLMWVTLILVLWAAWDGEARPFRWSLQNVVAVSLALLCALQVPWTIRAILYERSNATFPANATARFLQTLPPSKRIDGNKIAFTVMPYFPGYIFVNHSDSRFAAHSNYPADLSIQDFVAEHADDILLESSNVTDTDRRELYDAGYREKHLFCGGPYFPNRPVKSVCISFFEKN